MTTEQFVGLVRELLTAIGVALATMGHMGNELWQVIAGVVMSIVSIGWALKWNEGREILYTLIRKLLSGTAGLAVASGLLSPEHADVILGVLMSVAAIVWAVMAKGAEPPRLGPMVIWGTAVLLSGMCTSCITLDGPCAMVSYTRGDHVWKAGPCMGLDGQIERVRFAWNNPAGLPLRSEVYLDGRPTVMEMFVEGKWVPWTADVETGPLPEGMEVPPAPVATVVAAK